MAGLAHQPLRNRQDLREAVDENLGRGEGLSPGQAWDKLGNLERVEWILGEFWFGVSGHNFHLWIQSQAQRDLDGPRWVAAIGRAMEEIDPEVGRLVRWTAERGRAVRAEERGEPMFSVVTPIWEALGERARVVLEATIERWPDSLELASLEAPAMVERELQEPAADGCRYPGCAVGFTESANERCETIASGPFEARSAALLALWRHGASDEELDRFDEEVPTSAEGLPAALAEWVDFDGAGESLRPEQMMELQRALDPIGQILGVTDWGSGGLHRVEADRLDGLAEQLQPYDAARILPDEEAGFLARLRSCLRMDPSVILMDSAHIQTEDDVELIVRAIQTGYMVVLGGNADGATRLLEKLAPQPPA